METEEAYKIAIAEIMPTYVNDDFARRQLDRVKAIEAHVEAWKQARDRVSRTAVEVLIGRWCSVHKHKDLAFDDFIKSGGGDCPLCLKARIEELEAALAREKAADDIQQMRAPDIEGHPRMNVPQDAACES